MSDTAALARELISVRDLIRYGVTRMTRANVFFGHGCTNAWDESVWLVLGALELPLDRLEPMLDARLLADEREHVVQLIERRATERMPTAYLLGKAWLADVPFLVDPRVIIPRSLIASLLPEGLQNWLPDPEAVESVLDLCCGSASLAILAAQAYPFAQIDAADLSVDALAVARQNLEYHGLIERITLRQGDLLQAVPPHSRYDLILCNPPYVNSESMQALPAEFQHEPTLALAGGQDGMDLVRRLLREAAEHLTEPGILVLEIGHERDHFEAAFPELDVWWLDTDAGSDEVLLITREALLAASQA